MPGLAFDAIDQHVIDGRGEELCIIGAEREVSYIDLLAHTAALGGGLRRLGAIDGAGVSLELDPGWDRLSYLLALIRLGVAPAFESRVRVSGDPSQLQLGSESLSLETVVKLGRIDPVAAPNTHDAHLLEGLTSTDREWITTLTTGAQVRLL